MTGWAFQKTVLLVIHCIVSIIAGLLALRGLGPIWALVIIAPLAALAPGIYGAHLSRLRLAAIVLVPYVTIAIMEAVANTEARFWAAVLMFGLLLELTLIIGMIRAVQLQPIRQNSANKGHG